MHGYPLEPCFGNHYTFATEKQLNNLKKIAMRTIENIKSGRNYATVNVGNIEQIIECQLPMGPHVIQGKVFVG